MNTTINIPPTPGSGEWVLLFDASEGGIVTSERTCRLYWRHSATQPTAFSTANANVHDLSPDEPFIRASPSAEKVWGFQNLDANGISVVKSDEAISEFGGGGGGPAGSNSTVGLATEATLASIDTAVGTLASEATLDLIHDKLPASLGVKAVTGSLSVTLATDDAQAGTDATAAVAPAGAAGIRGWLSSLYKVMADARDDFAKKLHVALTDGTNLAAVIAGNARPDGSEGALAVSISPGSNHISQDVFTILRLHPGIDNTPTAIKVTAGRIHGINIVNLNAYPVFVKFYDEAAPNVATSTPVMVIAVTANGAFYERPDQFGLKSFDNSIRVLAVQGFDDTDDTAPGTPVALEVHYA